jgi:hypothetical protein
MNTFIDEGIAHIARVMRPALYGDLGGSYLPSAYWRQRLYQILDTTHLTNAQLRRVDSLLLELDEFDSASPPSRERAARADEQIKDSARLSRLRCGGPSKTRRSPQTCFDNEAMKRRDQSNVDAPQTVMAMHDR